LNGNGSSPDTATHNTDAGMNCHEKQHEQAAVRHGVHFRGVMLINACCHTMLKFNMCSAGALQANSQLAGLVPDKKKALKRT
jgi:hypothetical protein